MADYLTDEEQAERLKAWWDKNGTSLIVSLVVAVAAVVGWRYYQAYSTDRANVASEAFRGYLEARAAAEPVEEYLQVIDSDHEGSTYHVFTLFYRAADQVQEEDWEEALALLERAVELADERNVRDSARFRAAKLLYQLDRLDACAEQLARDQESRVGRPSGGTLGGRRVRARRRRRGPRGLPDCGGGGATRARPGVPGRRVDGTQAR